MQRYWQICASQLHLADRSSPIEFSTTYLSSFMIWEQMPVCGITTAWDKQRQKKAEQADMMKTTAGPHERMLTLQFLSSWSEALTDRHYSNAGLVTQSFNEWHLHVGYGNGGYIKIQLFVKFSVSNVHSLSMSSLNIISPTGCAPYADFLTKLMAAST